MHLESYFFGFEFWGILFFGGFEFRVILLFWVVEICSRTSIPVKEMFVHPPLGFRVISEDLVSKDLFGFGSDVRMIAVHGFK